MDWVVDVLADLPMVVSLALLCGTMLLVYGALAWLFGFGWSGAPLILLGAVLGTLTERR